MNNGPKLWNKLIDESGLNMSGVIMGGAIVDYAGNVEPKDYDLFHPYTPGEPEVPQNWKMTEVDFNDPVWIEEHQQLYMQGNLGEGAPQPVGSVYEYLVDGEHLVQLVGVHYADARKHMANFDHSLTLGWFSRKGLFVHSKVFKAFADEVVEYIGKDKSPQARFKSCLRAVKKTEKYGGEWTFKGFNNEAEAI